MTQLAFAESGVQVLDAAEQHPQAVARLAGAVLGAGHRRGDLRVRLELPDVPERRAGLARSPGIVSADGLVRLIATLRIT